MNFIYQLDHNPKHISKVKKGKVSEENVVQWLGKSPGLNPIEQLVEWLKESCRQEI